MKVFCIGLSRTSTTSLSVALNELGIKTRHFIPELFVNQNVISPELSFSPQIKLNFYWDKVRNSEIRVLASKNANDYFNNFQGFADLPIPLFYKELDKKFPGSKFIYTYRNTDKWLKSMKWLLSDGQILWKSGFINEEIRLATYNTRFYNDKKLKDAFEKHHQEVLDYFKDRSNDILIVNIDEKRLEYKDICNFLSLPLIDKKFPIANKPVSVSRRMKMRYWFSKNIILYSAITKICHKLKYNA